MPARRCARLARASRSGPGRIGRDRPSGSSRGAFVSCYSACALAFTDGAHAGQAAVGYLGVYVFAGFAWAWLIEGFRSEDWNAGEAGLCAISVAMVASAIVLS